MNSESRIKQFDPSFPSPGLGREKGRGRTIFRIIFNTAIGISPAKLNFNLKKGETSSQKIFLQNLEVSPTKVSVSLAEPKYQKRILINPAELILPSQEIRELEVTTESKSSFETQIQIQELTKNQGEFSVTSGVRIRL